MKHSFSDKHKKALIDDLCDLIAVDTSNPPGNELEAAELVQHRMAALGIDCDLQEIAAGRANAVCRIPFLEPDKGPCLILNSHLDVVPPGNTPWMHPPFEPRIVENRLYGRGATDAKGSVAAMMAAIRMVLESGKDLRGELVFTAVAAEETGGLGTRFWIKSRESYQNRSIMAVVGEPTGLVPLIAHKGVCRRKVIVQGRSAHSSQPSEGINAIYPIAHLAIYVKSLNDSLSEKRDTLLGHPVVSACVVKGGTKANVIPDYCELQIDRRLIPEEKSDQIDKEIGEWQKSMSAKHPFFKCQIQVIGVDKQPVIISKEEPIVQLVLEAVYAVTGRQRDPMGMQGATDMSILVHQGNIPTVIFGPGHLEQTHIVDEFVEIEQLETAVRVYADLISRVLARKG